MQLIKKGAVMKRYVDRLMMVLEAIAWMIPVERKDAGSEHDHHLLLF